MKRKLIKYLLKNSESEQEICLAGWVRTRRDSKGGFSFIEVNDGSCFANMQVIADSSLENYTTDICRLHPGASILVEGKLIESKGQKQPVEVHASRVEVLGHCDPLEYPLGKQRISFEKLRDVAHLRARTNTFGAIARLRNVLARETHQFFQGRDFIYLHTPIITASDCEGAGEMFQVTTLDMENPPRDKQSGKVDYSEDFFGKSANLTVSGQLEAETYACALSNVYTFGPTFRAENSNTRRHLAEFWMIEPEMAFADLNDDADLAEAYLRHLFNAVLANCQDDLDFFNSKIDNGLIERLQNLSKASFERLDYGAAIEILQKSGEKFEFKPEWGCDLQSEHERFLTEKVFNTPVIVVNYPEIIKAFYMRRNDDNKTVAAMDVLLPQVGEIIGGSQREDRLDVLEERIRGLGFLPEDYWWYCDLRRFGSVPHAGFGLGFERIVQFCSGMHNIRDVIPFPRAPRTCEF